MQIKGRTRTASSITYQTLFKYYTKLSGMTVTPCSSSFLMPSSMWFLHEFSAILLSCMWAVLL